MKKTQKERISARFRGNQIFHKLQGGFGHELNPRQWVFIVGCYNSGTTLLQDILSTHPDIGAMNDEGVMLTNELPRPEDFGWRRMWWKCEDKMMVESEMAGLVAGRVKKQWSHYYSKKPILIEKSISNVPRMDFFKKNFAPARFIHIVRNGYAVAEGISRKAVVMNEVRNEVGNSYSLDMCARQWSRTLEVINSFKDDSLLEISYEDLTERPEFTLERICSFLGVLKPDSKLNETRFTIHGQTNPIVNMNEESLKRLSENDRLIIESVAGNWLDKYGYKI